MTATPSREILLGPDALEERLDHVPVLGDVAVLRRLVGDDRHQADFGVLLFDQVLAGLALDLAAEEHLQPGVEGVDLQGVFGPEELHAQAQPGADVAPARRRLDDDDLAVVVPVLDERAGEILGRPVEVVGLPAAVLGQDGGVFRLLPLEAVGVGRDADRGQDIARRARRRQHEPGLLDRMAHHVVEDAAALQRAFPEPGHVRVRCAPRPRGPGRAGRPGPRPRAQTISLPRVDGRGEDLVFEVAVEKIRFPGQGQHLLGFLDVPAERLFAGDADELGRSRVRTAWAISSMTSHPGEVRGADPEGVDGRIGGHGR